MWLDAGAPDLTLPSPPSYTPGTVHAFIRGVMACAFGAMSVQAPWLHGHQDTTTQHYQHEHAGFGAVHAHDISTSDIHVPGTSWDHASSDADRVLTLGPVHCVRTPPVGLAFAPVAVRRVGVPPVSAARRLADLAPRTHDPPALSSIPPRAPPA
jgi:hypothetical protein